MGKLISFKSEPFFYYKEEDGTKPNTVRKVEPGDPRFEALDKMKATHIKIVHSANGKSFIRKITDISYMSFFRLWIISWEHNKEERKFLAIEKGG